MDLNCQRCVPTAKLRLGCEAEGQIVTRSVTEPELPPRRRCKKAILNPATDAFDPDCAEVLSLHGDLEAYHVAPQPGGWDQQAAVVVDALRVVRGTIASMERKRMAHMRADARRKAKR
jgi:hypothetical protein